MRRSRSECLNLAWERMEGTKGRPGRRRPDATSIRLAADIQLEAGCKIAAEGR
ncbi:hypothetical protein [Paenibacillus sp. PL2-23]|uniref:hypothetical protein n=1 Tax=Paenibacillus sp. PL2-23 TaxID=2100729 RepID=UPI0040469D6B